MKKTRVRYAPSPTGYLHIGNARTALFNYLFAKNLGGEFIIRIEDTDIKRNIVGGEQSQLDNLAWLGLKWDESIDVGGPFAPYNQLARLEQGLYKPYIDQLLDQGDAYKCFCTSEELETDAEAQRAAGKIPKYSGKCRHNTKDMIQEYEKENKEYTIRFKVTNNKEYRWNDIVKKDVVFNSKDVSGDFNIVKRDGIPTYNFVVVIDDYLMEITHILRGEDHISNTPKQLMIYEALGFEIPIFGHMSLIVNDSGKKLSKRDTSIIQFIEDYKDLGYLSEAMFNFIALLGWSPNSNDEIFSNEELCKIFDADRLSKSSAKFDVNKLTWINNQYMKKLNEEDYLNLCQPFLLKEYPNLEDVKSKKICLLFKDQISYGAEIVELSKIFIDQFKIELEGSSFIANEESKLVITTFLNEISKEETLSEDIVKELIKTTGKITQLKGKVLFMSIRIATTGLMHGPELATSLEILGKTKVIENLETVIKSMD